MAIFKKAGHSDIFGSFIKHNIQHFHFICLSFGITIRTAIIRTSLNKCYLMQTKALFSLGVTFLYRESSSRRSRDTGRGFSTGTGPQRKQIAGDTGR